MSDTQTLRLQVSLACWTAVVFAILLDLHDPWWAAISAFIVTGRERTGIIAKGLMRVIGTVLGCAGAYFIATIFAGWTILLATIMVFAAILGVYKRFTSRFSYAWVLAAVTGALVIFVSLETPDATRNFAIERSLEIIVGVLAAMLAELVFDPGAATGSAHHDGKASDDLAQQHAIEAGLFAGFVMVAILVLDRLFDLPSPIQIIITALVMIQMPIGYTGETAFHRLFGCVAGGAAGLLVIVFLPPSFLLWSLFLIAGIFVFSRTHFSGESHAYVGTQAAIAYLMALVAGDGPPATIEPALDRLAGIGIGVCILVAGNLLVSDIGKRVRRESGY